MFYTPSLNRAVPWIFESVKSWLTPKFVFIAREKKASLMLQELVLKENQVPQDKLDPRYIALILHQLAPSSLISAAKLLSLCGMTCPVYQNLLIFSKKWISVSLLHVFSQGEKGDQGIKVSNWHFITQNECLLIATLDDLVSLLYFKYVFGEQ